MLKKNRNEEDINAMAELIPSIFSKESLERLKQELVIGLYILDDEGQGCEIAGHVTSRLPMSKTFWTNRFLLGFDEATVEELNEIDLDLNIISGHQNISPALSLHAAIYKKNPKINAVVHTHPVNSIALSAISNMPKKFFLELDQQAAPFFDLVELYDEHHGVFTDSEGQIDKVADAIIGKRALILKNHGVLVVGQNVREAIVGAIILEKACEIQIRAMAAGGASKENLKLLPKASAAQAKKFLSNPELFDHRFNYFARRSLRNNPILVKRINN